MSIYVDDTSSDDDAVKMRPPSPKRRATIEQPSRQIAATEAKREQSNLAPMGNMVPINTALFTSPILRKVHELTQALVDASPSTTQTLANLNLLHAREVREMSPIEVVAEIERVIVTAVQSILRGESFEYTVPTRSAANQLYVPELDRIVLADKVSSRPFTNIATV